MKMNTTRHFNLWREEWDVILEKFNTQGKTVLEAQWQRWQRDRITAATELELNKVAWKERRRHENLARTVARALQQTRN